MIIGKKLDLKLKFLQARYPNAEIEIWGMDEHRLGLHPILRRVWVPEGEQPIACRNTKVSMDVVVWVCTPRIR